MSHSSRSKPSAALDRYDWRQSYRWNYEHAPDGKQSTSAAAAAAGEVTSVSEVATKVAGEWDFLGIPVGSPLGIAAGPLLNGAWCLHYARLGFDVLTYKTVRSGQRECYPLPNLQPVACRQMRGTEQCVNATSAMEGSWAVSFGMPSSDPEVWRKDVQWTRDRLPGDQVLSVSVVGTVREGWDLQRLAEDYALCARWAVESGADCIEANFSCPNVSTCDGQLYQDAEQSRLVAEVIRDAIGKTPLIIKIGYVPPEHSVEPLVTSLGGVVDALAMTNSIASKVVAADGELMFGGQQRGICGDAIRDRSVDQVRRFAEEIRRQNRAMQLVGVGGIHAGQDVRAYLDAGAAACHLATAAMVDPEVGWRIRRDLAD